MDGAFGASAALAPELRRPGRRDGAADSLAFDLHKWMYLPYEIGCVLVRDAEAHRARVLPDARLPRARDARLCGRGLPWFSDYGVELSRGFRALKAWMALKEHGAAKFGRIVQQNVEQARYLGELVSAEPELELLAPVALNIVCFRYVRPAWTTTRSTSSTRRIEIELQERGIAVPSLTISQGRTCLRVAITNHRSRREDFDLLVREVVRLGGELAAG